MVEEDEDEEETVKVCSNPRRIEILPAKIWE